MVGHQVVQQPVRLERVADRLRVHAHVDHVGSGREGARFQRPVPVLLQQLGKRRLGVHRPGFVFQIPVVAASHVARRVVAGRHVGPGQLLQRADELPPGLVASQVAAVQQQVRPVPQRVPPSLDLCGVLVQVLRRERHVAQLEHPGPAVRDDVNRVQVADILQHLGQSLDAVHRRVDQDRLDLQRPRRRPAAQVVQQLLVVLDAAVDHHQLAPHRQRLQAGRQGPGGRNAGRVDRRGQRLRPVHRFPDVQPIQQHFRRPAFEARQQAAVFQGFQKQLAAGVPDQVAGTGAGGLACDAASEGRGH